MATTRRLLSSVAALLLMAVASPLSPKAAKSLARARVRTMATTRRLVSSVAALLLMAVASPLSPEAAKSLALPGCQATCGGVHIPYPFGIGANCSHDGFEIKCTGSTPFLAGTVYKVLNLSLAPSLARVELPIAWKCYNASGVAVSDSDARVSFDLQIVYRISDTHNKFVSTGCVSTAYIQSKKTNSSAPWPYDLYTGCESYCTSADSATDGRCAGVGCCTVDIPPGLTDSSIDFYEEYDPYFYSFSHCKYAFLVDRDSYTFRRDDLNMDRKRKMPVWLDWAIRPPNASSALTCADANKDNSSYTCKSKNSECFPSTNGPGYICNCSKGYEGNAYLVDGCTDIDECLYPEKYRCHGVCRNTVGSYECKCKRGSHGDPLVMPCDPDFSRAAQLAIGIVCSISFLVILSISMLMVHHKRKLSAFFKRNGGPMLEKINNIKIFTKEELNQITRNFSTVLGKGGFGEVYMGTLGNKQQVAVKRSITVDETRKKEFANEVIIMSQISHKNVVRLLGCCLEVDVPMLVYEFVPKGSLDEVLHGTKKNIEHPLLLGIRLDVAVDSAEALAYMHSSTAQIILHGDVKSGNILLDDNFMPKVSDFGTSRLLSIEKDHTIFVIGDANYIDPVYMKTGLLTEKSDVYSFGVVLLELITGKKPRYDGNNSLVMNFLKSYRAEDKAREMLDKEIASGDEDIECLTKVGSIAVDCLKEDVEDRPTMKQVADYLQLVRKEWKQSQGKHDRVDEITPENLPASSTMVASCGENPN